MKEDKLKQAINDLPEFDAPDVWNEIEQELPSKKNRFIIPIILFVVFSVSAYFIVSEFTKTKSVGHGDLITSYDFPVSYDEDSLDVSDYLVVSKIEFSTESPVYVDEAEENQAEEIENHQQQLQTKVETSKIQIIASSNEKSIEKTVESVKQQASNISFFKIDYYTKITYEEVGDNLVRNPSFEDYNVCPVGINGKPSKKLLPDWYIPSKGTPDYFNVCCNGDAGIPNNFAGKIKPHSGDAYAGIILRQNFTRDNRITGEKPLIYREYLQNELRFELEAGKSYKIKFWICNSSKSRFAVDQIGASLTYDNGRVKDNEVLEFYPVVENLAGNFLSNQNYWVAIEGVYEAVGGEKYLTIGNFKNNFSTRYIMQNGNSEFNYAYYYIDDVSLVEVLEIVESIPVSDSSSYETVIQSDDQAYDF